MISVSAINESSGRGRPVELVIDRGLKSGKLDFAPLTDLQAIDLATDLLRAARISRNVGDGGKP